MSIALAWALAASSVNLSQCSWDRPGVNPYMGDVVAALDHYRDMPADVLARLKTKLQQRAYDDIVLIRRDRIEGNAKYGSEITDMHFGEGSVCHTVTRQRWPADQVERGLVFCEENECVVVPTVCRNVSRLHRLSRPQAVLSARDMEPEDQALVFDPPGAGAPSAGADPGLMGSSPLADSTPANSPDAGFSVPEGFGGGGGADAEPGRPGPGWGWTAPPVGWASGGGGGDPPLPPVPPLIPEIPELPPVSPVSEPASVLLIGAAMFAACWSGLATRRVNKD